MSCKSLTSPDSRCKVSDPAKQALSLEESDDAAAEDVIGAVTGESVVDVDVDDDGDVTVDVVGDLVDDVDDDGDVTVDDDGDVAGDETGDEPPEETNFILVNSSVAHTPMSYVAVTGVPLQSGEE
jgi:hypothetical protein